MKFFTKKSVVRKILLLCVILLLVNFGLTPYTSYALGDDNSDEDAGWSFGGTLAKEIMGFVCWLGDVVMGALNNFMLGASTGTRRSWFCYVGQR